MARTTRKRGKASTAATRKQGRMHRKATRALRQANARVLSTTKELNRRVGELGRLTGEMGGLIAGLDLPIVSLDRQRRILRFTPAAMPAFGLKASDIGRSFDRVTLPGAPDLEDKVRTALRWGVPIAREVQDRNGRWHLLRLRPQEGGGRTESLIVMLVDIDAARRRAAAVVETIREPLLVLDADFRVLSANPAFLETFRVAASEVERHGLFALGGGQWDFAPLRRLMKDVLPRHRRFSGYRVEFTFPQIGRRVFLLNGQQLYDEGIGTDTILLAFLDVTERERIARQLRTMSARLRSAREEEDKRVAHDLHDLSSEGLAALSLELARLEQLAASSPAQAQRGLKRVRERVRVLARDTHELARRLHPTVLDDLGLARALRAECRALEDRYRIKASVRLDRLPDRLPESTALCAYRVVQEALRNVARHARASKVDLRLDIAGGRLLLAVQDNGIGFDIEMARARDGLGLIGMEDRALAVGGTFAVKSTPRFGTTVHVSLPLRGRNGKDEDEDEVEVEVEVGN